MKRTIIAALTLATISTSALAGNPWVKYSQTIEGAEFWYNPQSVGRTGNLATARTLARIGSITVASNDFINCKTWKYTSYEDNGYVTSESYIVPNSPINTLAEKICK